MVDMEMTDEDTVEGFDIGSRFDKPVKYSRAYIEQERLIALLNKDTGLNSLGVR